MASATPERPEPAEDQRRALKYVERQTLRWRKAEREMVAAMRFANEKAGATLRQLEAASGIPFKTVDRMLERARSSEDDGGDAGDADKR